MARRKQQQGQRKSTGGTAAPKKKVNWPLIIGLIGVALPVFLGVLALLPPDMRDHWLYTFKLIGASATPLPTSVPTSEPTLIIQKMPAYQFNVVVAGFGYEQADKTVIAATISDDISDTLYKAIESIADNTLNWRASGVGRILGSTPEERLNQAAAIAESTGALVVVYGIVHQAGELDIIEPSFYVTGITSELGSELLGEESLGTPVEFVRNTVFAEVPDFQTRVIVLKKFIEGLGLYIKGDFDKAFDVFKGAISEENNIPVLYIFAGNAAVRSKTVTEIEAMSYYNNALALKPNYPRALIGRGIALLSLSMENPSAYDAEIKLPPQLTCSQVNREVPSDSQLQALLAENCFEQAKRAAPENDAEILIKVHFGLSQTQMWLSDRGANRWAEAEENLSRIINIYQTAPSQVQIRLRFYAGHAYAWSGLILLQSGSEAETLEAIDYYNLGIELLKADVQSIYNQEAIELYEAQVNHLNNILATDQMATDQP